MKDSAWIPAAPSSTQQLLGHGVPLSITRGDAYAVLGILESEKCEKVKLKTLPLLYTNRKQIKAALRIHSTDICCLPLMCQLIGLDSKLKESQFSKSFLISDQVLFKIETMKMHSKNSEFYQTKNTSVILIFVVPKKCYVNQVIRTPPLFSMCCYHCHRLIFFWFWRFCWWDASPAKG